MDLTAAATLFAWLDPDIWLVTAQAGGRRGGLIATCVTQASAVPELPRVLVGLAKTHHTWELVEAGRAFALHLLSEADLELVWAFGLDSGRDRDKFEGRELDTASTGSPLLRQSIGWLDCRVETSLEVGDRTLYLAEVVEGKVLNFAPPLRSQRLMELASPSRLAQMQRRRHAESYGEIEAIQAWRERSRG